MIKARFMNLLKSQLEDLIKLTQTKGEEYAQSDDQLANFKRQAAELEVAKEKVLGVYLNKHMDSIKGYIADPTRPLSEPIEGRIDDAILYLILLKAMVVEKRELKMGQDLGILNPDPPQMHSLRGSESGQGSNTPPRRVIRTSSRPQLRTAQR